LLSLVALPLAIKECLNVSVRSGKELNASLAGTARTLMIFGLLLTIGLILAKP
jgi:1,4-dihydroxy-2-naphthoate octaprenyltransferase